MGVNFNWQVEDDREWQRRSPSPRRQLNTPWRWVGVALLALLVATGAVAGVVWQRGRQGQARLKSDLETVANREAQAARVGDLDAFRSLQDLDDAGRDWRYRFSHPEPGWEGHLAVLDAGLVSDDRAWAEVAWATGDGIYRRLQFYRYVQGRWLRTAAQREPFGPERTLETAHFAFAYLSRDGPAASWMARQLEAWYQALCADLACKGGPRIGVRIAVEDQAGRLQPPEGLVVRSPWLRGVREDGTLLPEEREELAHVLALLLAARQAGNISTAQQPYLLPQFANWGVRRLGLADEDTPPTPVLDGVMASHGIEGIRALLEAAGQTDSEDAALHLALTVRLGDLDMAWGQYLTALLAIERQMLEWQVSELVGLTSSPLAGQIFGALQAEKSGTWRSERDDAFAGWLKGHDYPATPASRPAVDRWQKLDEATIWAGVSYLGGPGPRAEGIAFHRVEFFRQSEGAWRHSPPDERFLGEEVALNSQHFRLLCHEPEAEWMARELVGLESFYRQVAGALRTGLSPGERLTIRVVPATTYSSGRTPLGEPEVWVPSPYFSGWSDEQGERYLVGWVTQPLLARLAYRAAGITTLSSGAGPRDVWLHSVLGAWQWDMVMSGMDDAPPWFRTAEPLASAVKADKLLSLSEMERMTFGSGPGTGESSADDWDLLYQEAFTVMHYAGEAYGQQVFLSLLQSLSQADSLESWLRLALGPGTDGEAMDVDLQTFETGWRAWLRELVLNVE